MNDFAPIAITAYARLEHLKKTVAALQANHLAPESDLFILSDAPRKGDEGKVGALRRWARDVSGFRRVNVVERKENDRVANEIEGMRFLLENYGKMIFLEEDVMTSRHFLEFLNRGLEKYGQDRRIFAVCAYNEPVDYRADYRYDVYLSTYFSAWGFATWADRGLMKVINSKQEYLEMRRDRGLRRKIRKTHPHLLRELKRIHEGELDAADYEIAYHLRKNGLYSLRPVVSYVNNIGLDGSGEHCDRTNKFYNDVDRATGKIILPDYPQYDPRLDRESYTYRVGGFTVWQRQLNKLREKIRA